MRSARSISMAASFPPSRERVAAKSSSISRTSATQASRSSADRSSPSTPGQCSTSPTLKGRAAVPDARPLSVGEVLHWPGVLGDDRSAELREACVALVREILEDFAATRSREGGKLAAMLIERAERMKSLLASIQPKLPEAIAAYEEKLAARLREVLGGTDEERIRQEIALYGVKVDVAEELNRLGAHLEEVQRVVKAGGAAGKRLDFLMQELNREANTLGSKSVSKELSDASLEFKLLIEQMREQIQNIE